MGKRLRDWLLWVHERNVTTALAIFAATRLMMLDPPRYQEALAVLAVLVALSIWTGHTKEHERKAEDAERQRKRRLVDALIGGGEGVLSRFRSGSWTSAACPPGKRAADEAAARGWLDSTEATVAEELPDWLSFYRSDARMTVLTYMGGGEQGNVYKHIVQRIAQLERIRERL